MKQLADLIKESSLSRIRAGVDNHDSGAITAFRGEFVKAENKSRNKKLLAFLKSKGYSITSVKGSYIENFGSKDAVERGEESFFVVDHKDTGDLKATLERLGALYDQDSILWIPKGTKGQLVGTSKRENAWPPYKQTMDFSRSEFGKVAGAFFSRIKGRQFTFAEADEVGAIVESLSILGYEQKAPCKLAEEVEDELASLDEAMLKHAAQGVKIGASAGEVAGVAGAATGAVIGGAAGLAYGAGKKVANAFKNRKRK